MKVHYKIREQENYESLKQALETAPELFREITLKNFWRMHFPTQKDFDDYLKETIVDLENYYLAKEKLEESKSDTLH